MHDEDKTGERLFEQYTARLQALTRRLVEVQEEERRRLARELHDGVCQILTSLGIAFDLTAIAPAEQVPGRLRAARALLDKALTQVRELSFDLRPGMLDHLGLLPALGELIKRYTASTGVEVNFKHSGAEKRFIPELETAAFRMVQEALNNVARHAQVREATVRVWVDDEILAIQVEDKGVGFDTETMLLASNSNGLTAMRERAMLLGGRIAIESTPGGGTHLLVELPLSGHDGRKIDEHFHRLGR